jgi:hypothetical protein
VGPPRQTTTRVQDGTPTAGPVVEIKESIGGWPLFEADDLDAAIEQAARSPVVANGRRGVPSSRMGGADSRRREWAARVDVRPVVEGWSMPMTRSCSCRAHRTNPRNSYAAAGP